MKYKILKAVPVAVEIYTITAPMATMIKTKIGSPGWKAGAREGLGMFIEYLYYCLYQLEGVLRCFGSRAR